MGTDEQLSKFNMTLDVTIPGVPKLIWTRKNSVVSEIIVVTESSFNESHSSFSSVSSDIENLMKS